MEGNGIEDIIQIEMDDDYNYIDVKNKKDDLKIIFIMFIIDKVLIILSFDVIQKVDIMMRDDVDVEKEDLDII